MAKSLNKYIPDKDIIKSLCVQNKKLITEIGILEKCLANKDLRINQLKNHIGTLQPYRLIFEELKGEDKKDTKDVARNIGYVSRLMYTHTQTVAVYVALKKERDKLKEELIQLQIKTNS